MGLGLFYMSVGFSIYVLFLPSYLIRSLFANLDQPASESRLCLGLEIFHWPLSSFCSSKATQPKFTSLVQRPSLASYRIEMPNLQP